MAAPRKYSREVRERAVHLVLDGDRPIAQVARAVGVHRETLRLWVREARETIGEDGPPACDPDELVRLRKENAELKRINDLLRAALVFFASELARLRLLDSPAVPARVRLGADH
ncbi:transposase [Actinomadura meridiana]|uniref:Transposase n=1 Tax=Actinomadura meridiana TaxID=559626 RepID=A0ABP8C2G4_9ACTN